MESNSKSKFQYKEWNPGLSNGDQTLRQARSELPANSPEEISKIVRLLENPESPIALKGAVSLDRHDCIHIMLGRGLLPQDEAFVIGFTMGTSKDISRLEEFIFKKVSMYFYPKKYRFTRKHMKAYDIGLEYGKNSDCEKIYDFPFEDFQDWKIADLRDKIGVKISDLKEAFKKEQESLPNTKCSKRLDV